MTAAEQQISGNPAAMENAQARTTVTDQAKVQDIISRMDRAHETPMFHRIVTLVAAGMLMDSIDVYTWQRRRLQHVGYPLVHRCAKFHLYVRRLPGVCWSVRCWPASSVT